MQIRSSLASLFPLLLVLPGFLGVRRTVCWGVDKNPSDVFFFSLQVCGSGNHVFVFFGYRYAGRVLAVRVSHPVVMGQPAGMDDH